MGQEILYCYKCQTRLLGSEFDKGKAFKVGDKAACAVCVKDLLGSVPPPPPKNEAPKIGSSNRLPAASPDSSSKFKPATVRAAAPEPEKSRTGLIIGAVIGVAVVILLIAMAMSSGSRTTVRRDPDPPTPAPVPPGVRPPDPTPAPVPLPTSSFAAELREIDEKIRTGLPNEDFRSLSELLAEARKRRSSGEWLSEIDLRIPQVEARARRTALPLREKGVEANKKGDAAEVKRLREKIASWGFPTLVDEFDKALAAPTTPPPPIDPPPGESRPVFLDALGPGCRNRSWSGVVDLAATAQVHEGTHSIAFTPQQMAAGVYISFDMPVDTAEFPFVTFAVYLPEIPTGVGVALYKDATPAAPVGLEHLGGYPGAREWKKFVVPVATLNAAPQKVTGFVVQVFRTGTQPLVYIDSVAFLKTAPAGAVLPKPPPDPNEPPAVVYDEALAPGWANWSWSGKVDLAATTQVFEGSRAISFTPDKESAGVYLHFAQGLDPDQYPFVTFAVYAVEDPSRVGAAIYKDKKTTQTLPLSQLAPDVKTREWKRYVVPVEKLNAAPGRITGFQIQAYQVGTQPIIYIDSIAFLKGSTLPKPPEVDAYRARFSLAAA